MLKKRKSGTRQIKKPIYGANSMSSVDSVLAHECQFTVEKTEQQITKVSGILQCKDDTFNPLSASVALI